MMAASNPEISAKNRSYKVLLSDHTKAWHALDDDGLKSDNFSLKLASQSAAFSPYGLFWMMTASNWEVSAENQPHKVLL